MRQTFPYAALHAVGSGRTFSPASSEAAFLLGGIGTGNVSVGARGELRDWEIFNNPNKGFHLPCTFFSIWAKAAGREPAGRVLESRIRPPYGGPHGFRSYRLAGLPRFADSRMRGEYPFVWVDLIDDSVPVSVGMEAFTPFIPLDADDSGIPGAVIRYTATNASVEPADVAVSGSLANMAGFAGLNELEKRVFAGPVINEYREEPGFRGWFLRTESLPPDHLRFGSLALFAAERGGTADGWTFAAASPSEGTRSVQDFWDDFRSDGRLDSSPCVGPGRPVSPLGLGVGYVGAGGTIAPGESRIFEFAICWYFPNRPRCWQLGPGEQSGCGEIVRNHYAARFTDAWDAGRYMLSNLERLERATRDFHRALFSSTYPSFVLDAVSANITVLRSPTCFRLEDGTFAGWEGCRNDYGCCPGSCTHVWNYAQTAAFLFPELEQSMRRVEFELETDGAGEMAFRSERLFGLPRWEFHPAVDGQMGTIVRLYRDWKLSGDGELLRAVWEKASLALDFAFTHWDRDGDCVLDGEQHNTYDIEFHGPNSLSNSLFFAALAAGREMAEYLGDADHAARYAAALSEGAARMDAMLWGGEYYVQKLADVNEHSHQYGRGCLSDQLLGQLVAHVAGLGYILPEEHVRTAVESVFRFNFRSDFFENDSTSGRTYALNDEKGLLLCSWPRGGRPRRPFFYSDEVWTGVEYQVAAHLIFEGFVDEGLTVVKAVRDRHDGVRRNPWNEVECGHHYVRSMASWTVLLALSGFRYDLSRAGKADPGSPAGPYIAFEPRINADDFSTFFSTGRCWGIYRQKKNPAGGLERSIEVLYGELGDVALVDAARIPPPGGRTSEGGSDG